MEDVMILVASNALTATLLALIVAAIALRLRQPAVVHLLWIVVLLRLFAPPLLDFNLLPTPANTVEIGSLSLNPAASSPTPEAPSDQPRPLAHWLFGTWVIGALAMAAIANARTRRFQTIVDAAEAAGSTLETRVRRIAEAMGCSRIPRTLIVDQPASPMIWSAFRRPILVLPRSLMVRLTDSQLDTIIAHEMAHLKRGDHRVRWMELAALVLFWWNPTTWWACRNLRQAEEECCDLMVTAALPDRVRDYANSLVEAVRHSSTTAWPVDVASPLSQTRSIERRITHMFMRSQHGTLNTATRISLILAAVLTLGLTPMLTAREVGDADHRTSTGEAITITLQDAELRDVLTTFSELADIDILIEPSVSGRVSVELVDVPWDQALTQILNDNGLVYTVDHGRFIVRKAADSEHTPATETLKIEGYLGPDPVYRFVDGNLVSEPHKISGPNPEYPETARDEGVQGVVVMETTIRADGTVHQVDVLRSPDQRLSQAANEAVRLWTFEPALMDGQPVAVKYILTVRFNLL